MPAPASSLSQLNTWKNHQMRTFAVALIAHALARLNAGEPQFTVDCVPDAERICDGQPIAKNVPGNVITQLKYAHVIRAVGVVVNGKFYADSEKSSRDSAKTRPVDKYELCSRPVAQEFLLRNRIDNGEPQLGLFADPTRDAENFA
ncbi:MAG: hypothetical protein KGL39_58165 [Patescibacteria group bacterium]|nr:hypothetical protein [Patescibacteria group bacterium]